MFNVNKDKASIRAAICSAIKSRRVMEFYYHDGFRVVEPFCLVVTMSGRAVNESLLCYQVGGHSQFGNKVGWKLYRASEITELEITSKQFDGDWPCCDPEDVGGYVKEEVKRAREAVTPVMRVEKSVPHHEESRKKSAVFFHHNELMRRFRSTHPVPVLS